MASAVRAAAALPDPHATSVTDAASSNARGRPAASPTWRARLPWAICIMKRIRVFVEWSISPWSECSAAKTSRSISVCAQKPSFSSRHCTYVAIAGRRPLDIPCHGYKSQQRRCNYARRAQTLAHAAADLWEEKQCVVSAAAIALRSKSTKRLV